MLLIIIGFAVYAFKNLLKKKGWELSSLKFKLPLTEMGFGPGGSTPPESYHDTAVGGAADRDTEANSAPLPIIHDARQSEELPDIETRITITAPLTLPPDLDEMIIIDPGQAIHDCADRLAVGLSEALQYLQEEHPLWPHPDHAHAVDLNNEVRRAMSDTGLLRDNEMKALDEVFSAHWRLVKYNFGQMYVEPTTAYHYVRTVEELIRRAKQRAKRRPR